MKAVDLIKAIVADSGMSQAGVSVRMGHNKGYIASKISAGSPPNIGTVVAICAATGHEVIIRNRETGKELVVDDA